MSSRTSNSSTVSPTFGFTALPVALGLITTACSENVVEPSSQSAEEQTNFALGSAGPAAHGNAGIDFGGEVQTTAFTANGATGQVQIVIKAFGLVGHGQIDCLNVDGNTATMSGVLTLPHDAAGLPILFRVVDNGQGKGARGGVDQFSLVFFGEPERGDCNTAGVLDLFPIVRGNVTVRE